MHNGHTYHARAVHSEKSAFSSQISISVEERRKASEFPKTSETCSSPRKAAESCRKLRNAAERCGTLRQAAKLHPGAGVVSPSSRGDAIDRERVQCAPIGLPAGAGRAVLLAPRLRLPDSAWSCVPDPPHQTTRRKASMKTFQRDINSEIAFRNAPQGSDIRGHHFRIRESTATSLCKQQKANDRFEFVD